MSLNAKTVPNKKPAGPRPETLSAGTYPVRLVQIVDFGLQKQKPWKGEDKLPELEIYLIYEFLDEFMKNEDGSDNLERPRWLGEKIRFKSLDADLALSTKRYDALDPERKHKGDWTKLLGAPGMLTITVSAPNDQGETRNYVATLASMRDKDAVKAPALVNEPKYFDLDNPDLTIFNSLPQWQQDTIKANLNFGGSKLDKLLGGTVAGFEVDEPEVAIDSTGKEEW